MIGKPQPSLLFIGTPQYDAPEAQAAHTVAFVAAGCMVTALSVTAAAPPLEAVRALQDAADVVMVAGGNTLFACERWRRLGLGPLLRDAIVGGTVVVRSAAAPAVRGCSMATCWTASTRAASRGRGRRWAAGSASEPTAWGFCRGSCATTTTAWEWPWAVRSAIQVAPMVAPSCDSAAQYTA